MKNKLETEDIEFICEAINIIIIPIFLLFVYLCILWLPLMIIFR